MILGIPNLITRWANKVLTAVSGLFVSGEAPLPSSMGGVQRNIRGRETGSHDEVDRSCRIKNTVMRCQALSGDRLRTQESPHDGVRSELMSQQQRVSTATTKNPASHLHFGHKNTFHCGSFQWRKELCDAFSRMNSVLMNVTSHCTNAAVEDKLLFRMLPASVQMFDAPRARTNQGAGMRLNVIVLLNCTLSANTASDP